MEDRTLAIGLPLIPKALVGLLSWLLCLPWPAAIVINEVCYDPQGSDEGYEWIELYNNGNANEQLEGATILSGGQSWTVQYTLPAFILRPGHFLLIAGNQIPVAQLYFNFNFQNGGSETDGIRYLSPDGSYSDTVLYDSPNSFGLSDDSGLAGTSFAPDVPAGYSLARAVDGQDSNSSAADFIAESDPTPLQPNRRRCDYALGSHELFYLDGYAEFEIWIKNLSQISPNTEAIFTIYQSEDQLFQQSIPPLAALDSLLVYTAFSCTNEPLSICLELADDPDSTNNYMILQLSGEQQSGVILSEFLANPESGNQEWVEVFNTYSKRGDYSIMDLSGNKIEFSLPAPIGYYVVCQDTTALRLRYPDCPPASIVSARSWTNLNNDGDSLVLMQEESTLDSLFYLEEEIIRGVSRERYLEAENVCWRNSFSSSGGTPGQPNSLPPQAEIPEAGNLTLSGSPCKPEAGEKISLAYHLKSPSNRISCSVFDMKGNKQRTLADYSLSSELGVIYWDGRKQDGSLVPRGLYIILWESQSSEGGKIFRKQLSAVINR